MGTPPEQGMDRIVQGEATAAEARSILAPLLHHDVVNGAAPEIYDALRGWLKHAIQQEFAAERLHGWDDVFDRVASCLMERGHPFAHRVLGLRDMQIDLLWQASARSKLQE